MKSVYVIDDIMLFNLKLDVDKEVYYFGGLKETKNRKWSPIVEFVTADIHSIIDITVKMQVVFALFRPVAVILRDDTKKRTLTAVSLLALMAKRKRSKECIDALVKKVDSDIERIFDRNSIRGRGICDPIYIKTAMYFGIQSGGAVAHSAGVISAMKKTYRDMEVYTTDFLPENLMGGYVTKISLSGFHDYYEEAKLYLNLSAYKEIRVKHGKDKPLFVYQRYCLYDYIGAKIAESYHVPFVLEWNGSEIWVTKSWGGFRFKYLDIAKKIETLNLKKADLITCVSKELKETLVLSGVPEDKILVNFNGVDVNKFSPAVDGDRIRKKYGLENAVIVGFCGSFAKFHGAEMLAETFGNLMRHHVDYRNKVKLLMIGEGNTLANVKRILKRKGVASDTVCAGSVPVDEVAEYLAACDILAAPHIPNEDGSEFFGSPTKLFEYMAMGKAIAASRLNQIGEILHNDQNALLFKPGDTEEMEKAIVSLIEDEALRVRLGKQARKDAGKYHTWDKHMDKIIAKLKEMDLLR